MTTFQHSMSADEYRKALERLGFAQTGLEADAGILAAGRFFGVAPRTAQAWAANGPPNPVAVCLNLMLAARIDRTGAHDLLLSLMPRGARPPRLKR